TAPLSAAEENQVAELLGTASRAPVVVADWSAAPPPQRATAPTDAVFTPAPPRRQPSSPQATETPYPFKPAVSGAFESLTKEESPRPRRLRRPRRKNNGNSLVILALGASGVGCLLISLAIWAATRGSPRGEPSGADSTRSNLENAEITK